jgi:hypothetical protein
VLPEGVDLVLGDFTRGLPPWLADWFFRSQDPLAKAQRERIQKLAAQHIEAANKRQEKRFEVMKHEASFIDPKADVRPIASIDPVIAQDMRNRYGSACWNDKKFLEDCRKKAPQLFYPK